MTVNLKKSFLLSASFFIAMNSVVIAGSAPESVSREEMFGSFLSQSTHAVGQKTTDDLSKSVHQDINNSDDSSPEGIVFVPVLVPVADDADFAEFEASFVKIDASADDASQDSTASKGWFSSLAGGINKAAQTVGSGAAYVGSKAVSGASYAGSCAISGASYVGRKALSGAALMVDPLMAVGQEAVARAGGYAALSLMQPFMGSADALAANAAGYVTQTCVTYLTGSETFGSIVGTGVKYGAYVPLTLSGPSMVYNAGYYVAPFALKVAGYYGGKAFQAGKAYVTGQEIAIDEDDISPFGELYNNAHTAFSKISVSNYKNKIAKAAYGFVASSWDEKIGQVGGAFLAVAARPLYSPIADFSGKMAANAVKNAVDEALGFKGVGEFVAFPVYYAVKGEALKTLPSVAQKVGEVVTPKAVRFVVNTAIDAVLGPVAPITHLVAAS